MIFEASLKVIAYYINNTRFKCKIIGVFYSYSGQPYFLTMQEGNCLRWLSNSSNSYRLLC